jgi:asparagine synthase (glutamine-hydrolysing)
MCGIAGFVQTSLAIDVDQLRASAARMGRAIAHRGPDDGGIWIDQGTGVALSHRRLAIVDLSIQGRQPMVSPAGRFVMVFNGEIYNYRELRDEIDRGDSPVRWRGRSDTEVLLAACDAWGVEGAVRRCNGMFAFAVWDRRDRELVLVRDRMGEKPLYYGWQGKTFLFGSELSALEAFPGFVGTLNPEAVSAYLRFAYVPSPLSIYRGIRKLPAGGMAWITPHRGEAADRISTYWSVPAPDGSETVDSGGAVDELHELLREAVKMRMHADVPIGAFLSGGIDSSAITALMQDGAKQPVRTYSIGLREKTHDEAANAVQVARALGTVHEELYVTAQDALNVIPQIPQLYSEPFADSSQVPTYLLSKLTRRHVTVAISGDGGDELFGGYVRYLQVPRLLKFCRTVPHALRRALAGVFEIGARPFWANLLAAGPRSLAVHFSTEHLAKLAGVMRVRDEREMYRLLVSQWHDPGAIAPGLPSGSLAVDDAKLGADCRSALDWLMYMDQLTYLPDDILVKVDRASMAVGLEARVPFLDHRVVEFASRLPHSMKIKSGQGKWALRQVLYRYVDPSLVDRPKQGFGIPLAAWLRGGLREWAEALLSNSALQEHGIFDAAAVRRVWEDHLAGRGNYHHRLWVVLMMQSWLGRAKLPATETMVRSICVG